MSAQGIRLSTSARADTSHQLVTRLDRLPVDTITNDIARGYVPGAVPFGSFGERELVGSTTNQIIWSNGAFSAPHPTGIQISVVSTSANDSAAGTGIRTLEIHYLDANLDEKFEVITMTGLTPVLTVATDIRFINLVHMVTFGSLAHAAGDISFTNGANNYAEILTGNAVQISSARMIPRGKVFYLAGATAGSVSGSTVAKVLIRLVADAYNGQVFNDPFALIPYGSISVQDNSVAFNFPVPFRFNAGVVVALVASSDKSCTVSGSIYGWLEDA
jgi:hypothetical protein